MAFKRKRIVILFCGGSTIDPRDRPGDTVRSPQDIPRWLAKMGELEIVADVEPVFVYGGEGATIGPRQWTALAQSVGRWYRRADGFLVIHSLESLATTANALSFMLQRLGVPVVLTGSPVRAREERSQPTGGSLAARRGGVKANFVNALQVAASDIAEVSVVIGSQILRGAQVVRCDGAGPRAFEAYDGSLLGKIDFGTRYYASHRRRRVRTFSVFPKVDRAVLPYHFTPGVEAGSLERTLQQPVHGVFVTGADSTALPGAVLRQLVRARRRGVAVALYTPRWDGRRRPGPFLIADRMAPSVALVKFMWARGQTADVARLQRLLERNIAGERVTARKEVRV